MLERDFEIIVRVCIESIFGPGWHLRAQQLSLDSGRIDLLLGDDQENLHLVEIKKGRAKFDALDQVEAYAADLRTEKVEETAITPWVIAHEVPEPVEAAATARGIRVLGISVPECERLMKVHGLDATDLMGRRRDGSALWGGGPNRGLRSHVSNQEALAEMPVELAEAIQHICAERAIELMSASMQSVLHYKGVKLGGINRQHRGGHSYISAGVVLTARAEKDLTRYGFHRMVKTQKGSKHEHIWWESPWQNVTGFIAAINLACDVVDLALREV